MTVDESACITDQTPECPAGTDEQTSEPQPQPQPQQTPGEPPVPQVHEQAVTPDDSFAFDSSSGTASDTSLDVNSQNDADQRGSSGCGSPESAVGSTPTEAAGPIPAPAIPDLPQQLLLTHGPAPSPTPPPEDASSPKAMQSIFPVTPAQTHQQLPQSALPPTPPPSAPRLIRDDGDRKEVPPPPKRNVKHIAKNYARINAKSSPKSAAKGYAKSYAKTTAKKPVDAGPGIPPHPEGELSYANAPSSFKLDNTRLGALDKAQRFWELQNDVSTEGVPPQEKQARLEMLGRDLISDLHQLMEASVSLEHVLKDERWRVWSTGATIAAGIPTFCFLTQYPHIPLNFDPSKFAASFSASSLPAKTVSTLHSIPAHPMSRAAGRYAGVAAKAGGQVAGKAVTAGGKAATAVHEGIMALSAATLALSLVPTAIGVIEVAFHERKLGDVQSWTEDLRNLAWRVGGGEVVDGMDMYCLSDERWDELPWKAAEEDLRDLCY